MENIPDISQEELKKLVEKAEKDMQAILEKMTPEEREQAQIKAQKAIQEDEARIQKLLDDAAALTSASPRTQARETCASCGAPAGSGNFCEYCGQPLR